MRRNLHCTLLSLHNCQQKPANCFQFAGTNSLYTSASQLTTCSALICCVVLCCDMLCCVMLYCAVPCHAKPCHATSCNATPCHVPLSCLAFLTAGPIPLVQKPHESQTIHFICIAPKSLMPCCVYTDQCCPKLTFAVANATLQLNLNVQQHLNQQDSPVPANATSVS